MCLPAVRNAIFRPPDPRHVIHTRGRSKKSWYCSFAMNYWQRGAINDINTGSGIQHPCTGQHCRKCIELNEGIYIFSACLSVAKFFLIELMIPWQVLIQGGLDWCTEYSWVQWSGTLDVDALVFASIKCIRSTNTQCNPNKLKFSGSR